ncbi:MAG: DNA ligase, NAD-dependent [Parcubacteria group bacterium Licking1014_17]|nr:MAG: DNA ligase, NAD-dependent [Parcubacteria group bacterium Licking1014_17]
MTTKEAAQRAEKLRVLINKYRYHRLVLDAPIIEESVEDSLKKELFDLEQQFPKIVTPDSPTQRVAGKPLDKFEKFTHPGRMLSFNDVFNKDDLNDWIDRVKRLDSRAIDSGFFCELKIDGLAIELIYKNGSLAVGATRGDGFIGENVTQNLKTVEAIPLKLNSREEFLKEMGEKGLALSLSKEPALSLSKEPALSLSKEPALSLSKEPALSLSKGLPEEIIVRGEVFLSKKEFERMNAEQKKAGEATYKNPRNLAAGSIRQLDPKLTASRKLDSYAYSLLTNFGQETHEEEHLILKALGFKTNPNNKYCRTIDEVGGFRDYWEKHREKLSYEIDGTVVIINDNKMSKKLGIIGKAPRAIVAYKFSPRESTTKLNDIIVSVGRTGTLTPVAVLEPVEIGGTTISRATLHNEDEIKRLGVKIGDTVVVGRAGDVIPDIKKVLKELRTGKEKEFHFPKKCPACEGAIVREEGYAAHKCVNENCPARKREYMYHFVSKGAMNIDGVGPKIIDQLVDAGLIRDVTDLYKLKKEDLMNLERFADKSAENTIGAIQSHKTVTLDRFVFSLGIPHVGIETAVDLARQFGTIEKIAGAEAGELNSIKDIGDVTAEEIYKWFKKPYSKKLLEKFKKAGVKVLAQSKSQKSQKLKGLSFIFTGSLDTITREDAEKLVRENGGDALSSISKETSYVVAGHEPGSKFDKAKKLGVKIISEGEFLRMVK